MGKCVPGFLKTEREFLRIGVSGHRFLAELDRLKASVDLATRHILQVCAGLNLHVVSSLAEGADRLVAEGILLQSGSKLTAVLPMPKEMYLGDFPSSPSTREFAALLARASDVVELPARQTREECYEDAGEYILNHCDVLFAVWDGLEARGIGGTAAIVARARQRSIPLVWIHAGNRVPGGTQPTSLGAEQGKVSFESMDGIARIASERNCESN